MKTITSTTHNSQDYNLIYCNLNVPRQRTVRQKIMKAVNSLLLRECHLRFPQRCCRIFGPSAMLHCVKNIPGNLHPQQKSSCNHFSSEISHYGVNEQTETTLSHTPYGMLIFHQRNASQNFITKLVMQSHVYCALQENNLKMTNDPLPTPFVPMQYPLSPHPTHSAYC